MEWGSDPVRQFGNFASFWCWNTQTLSIEPIRIVISDMDIHFDPSDKICYSIIDCIMKL